MTDSVFPVGPAAASPFVGADSRDTSSRALAERRTARLIASITEAWLFPAIVLSMVLGNQPFVVAQLISQVLNWANLIAGGVLLLSAMRAHVAIAALMLTILVAKVLRGTAVAGPAESVYVGAVGVLFCLAGAIVAYRRPTMLYRQVMTIAAANLVAMILQVVGAGAWTQLLTTHGEGNLTEPVRTLFVAPDAQVYLLVQGRPAGLSFSNIVLSLIITFAVVLHLTSQANRRWWGTTVLSGMVALSMSKFVLIVSPLLALWVTVTGRRFQRAAAFRLLAGIVAAIVLYSFLFPGLAATNLDVRTIRTSFYLRLNDIAHVLNPRSSLSERADLMLEGTPRATWVEEGAFVSGYAQVVAQAPTLVPIAVVTALVYLIGLRRLYRRSQQMMMGAFLAMCMVTAYPFTFPPWGFQIYWFMAGLGLVPLFGVLRPQFMSEDPGRREALPRGRR